MDDSIDDIIANLEIPEPPSAGPSASKLVKLNDGASTSSAASGVSSKNAIQVNPNQKGNPLLKAITSIPWEFNNEILGDYEVGAHACVLFLSIRYHTLKPEYLSERLKKLGKNYRLRVLLVHIDVKEFHNALMSLNRICFLTDLTLMVAWSPEEAGRIIESYKKFENAPADLIKEKPENDHHTKIVNALTSIRSVNKSDAMTLLINFGTLEQLIEAKEKQIYSCIGVGPRKLKKILQIINEPFLKSNTSNDDE